MSTTSEKQMESSIATMLLVGVITSAILVCLGGLLYLFNRSHVATDYSLFRPDKVTLQNIPAIIRGAARLDSASLVQLGILFLVATPVARVVFCVVGFLRQKDHLYVVVSSSVLGILIYSLLQGVR